MRFSATALLAVGGVAFSDAAQHVRGPIVKEDGPDSIFLTLAFCPTVFSGKGAVVRVDGATFKPEVVSKFDWPEGIDGDCPMGGEDPNFFSDTVVGTRRTHVSFGSVSARKCAASEAAFDSANRWKALVQHSSFVTRIRLSGCDCRSGAC